MSNITKMDPVHIQRMSFDPDNMATRVVVTGTEMDISIRAEHGDSVITQSGMTVLEVKAGEQFDTSKATKMCVLSEDITVDHVVATACVAGKELPMAALGMGEARAICVPALKLDHDCIVILQS